jgi:GxxExxY protein
MHYIIIGFGLLVGLYGLYRFFISAELRQISALFLTAAILTVCVSLFYMAISGRLAGAIGLVVAMLPIILSAYHRRRQAKKFAGQYEQNADEGGQKSSSQGAYSFNLTKKEAYEIIGRCIEVHNNLGAGFLEIVYKDALELEFRKASIEYEREKKYEVNYKGIILPHKFYANFVVMDKIILEVKAISGISDEFIAQAINYLKVSKNKLALIVNFGELRLNYKRIVY